MHFRFTRSPGPLIVMIRYRQKRELNRFTVFKLDPFSVTFRHYQPCGSGSMNRWRSHLFMSAVRSRRTAQERYSVSLQWACSAKVTPTVGMIRMTKCPYEPCCRQTIDSSSRTQGVNIHKWNANGASCSRAVAVYVATFSTSVLCKEGHVSYACIRNPRLVEILSRTSVVVMPPLVTRPIACVRCQQHSYAC